MASPSKRQRPSSQQQQNQRSHRPAARELTEEELVQIEFAFRQLAESSAGAGACGAVAASTSAPTTTPTVVGPKQLKTALRAFGFAVRRADVAALLRAHGHGDSETAALDAAAFRELVASQLARRAPGVDASRAFGLFDASRAGRVTAADLGQVAAALGASIPPDELRDMIAALDADGDGGVREAEFRTLMRVFDDSY